VKTGCNTLAGSHPVFFNTSVLVGDEVLFAYAANGAAPIVGKILKRGAGSDTAVGIALCGVINVAARLAHIFHAGFLLS
jgi:hypothetical protein